MNASATCSAFRLDGQLGSGVRLDLFVEKPAQAGFAAETGDYSWFNLVFAREY